MATHRKLHYDCNRNWGPVQGPHARERHRRLVVANIFAMHYLRVRLSIRTSRGINFSVVVEVASWNRVSFCNNNRPLFTPPGPSSSGGTTPFVFSRIRQIRTVDQTPIRQRNFRMTLALMFIILAAVMCPLIYTCEMISSAA